MNKEYNRKLNDSRNDRFVEQRFFQNKPVVFQQRKFDDLEERQTTSLENRKNTYINGYYQIKQANVQNQEACMDREGFLDSYDKNRKMKNNLIKENKKVMSFSEFLELKRKGLIK